MQWKWLKILPTILFLFNHLALPLAEAKKDDFDYPRKFLKEHYEKIITLSSDQEALAFHQRFMPKPNHSHHPPAQRKLAKSKELSTSITPEMQTAITTFYAALSAIATIQKLRAFSETPLNNHFFSQELPSSTQQQWILSKRSLKNFKHLLDFMLTLSAPLLQEPDSFPPNNDYAQFTYFHDHTSSTTGISWTNLLDDLGLNGIEAKLHGYWQQPEHQSLQPISDSQKMAYIQEYVTSRILPLFHASFLALAIEFETQAYDISWESWQRLQQWHEKEQIKQAKMRLCGNWKWIIHNHQNHGDHKTTMTFHPPEMATTSHVQPSTILIHGDTVYLKWTFPQGTQEDSLLLTNRDTRLEGTFTNSLGPHGSISGQRLSQCQN
jgi:hypothetical protein